MTNRMIATLLLSTWMTGALAETGFDLTSLESSDLPVTGAISTGPAAARHISVEDFTRHPDTGADVLIDLGSITKFVTAVAVLHLIDAGQLTTDTRLDELFADIPDDKAQIRNKEITQLISRRIAPISVVFRTGPWKVPLRVI